MPTYKAYIQQHDGPTIDLENIEAGDALEALAIAQLTHQAGIGESIGIVETCRPVPDEADRMAFLGKHPWY